MATAPVTTQQGQGQIGQYAQQQAGTPQPTNGSQPGSERAAQVQAETPPPRKITDLASI